MINLFTFNTFGAVFLRLPNRAPHNMKGLGANLVSQFLKSPHAKEYVKASS